jgi:hypothetical protein
MALSALLLFGGLAALHWIMLPARIENVRRIGTKMPTLQIVTYERVAYLEGWRSMVRVAMVAEAVLILISLRNT